MADAVKWNDLTQGKVDLLISAKKDFIVIDVPRGHQGDAVKLVKTRIENAGLKCRIYTSNRIGAAAASGLFAAPVAALAVGAIAIHNLVTYDPNYEISKDAVGTGLTVTYKK